MQPDPPAASPRVPTASAASSRPPRRRRERPTPAQSYAILVGAFLTLRGASTLLAGASFARPGDGWRAVYQLTVAAVLLLSARRRSSARAAVLAVGAFYALVTLLGILGGHDILGVVPVDARDKVVHPLLALAGLAIAAWETRAPRHPRPAAAA